MQGCQLSCLQPLAKTLLQVTLISFVFLTLSGKQFIFYTITSKNVNKTHIGGSFMGNRNNYKSIQASVHNLSVQMEEMRIQAVFKNQTVLNFSENTEKCIKRLPQAIIVGIQKSGTSALIQFLGSHPQIAACLVPAETQFFSRYYTQRSLEWYRNLMPCSFSYQITIEKSPPYFYRRFCAERIREMNPNTKIIIIAKDPIGRAISMFAMLREKFGNPSSMLFEDLVTINNHSEINEGSVFIDWSNYQKYMQAWLDNFKPKQILVIDGNSLQRDPALELNRVEKFLRIDTYFRADTFKFNETKGKYCLSNSKNGVQCLGNNKGSSHFEVQENVRSVLVKYFSSLNEIFFKMINKRFIWGY